MQFLIDGPETSALTVILAHGAGAPADSPAMNRIANGLGAAGWRVLRFEFPYMAARREGRRPGPDRQAVLLDTWRRAVEEAGEPGRLIIGGKSMGGRMASLVADELGVCGLLCFGFPFHAPGRSPAGRIEHLATLRTPTLILQGTRDPFGTREDVATYALSDAIRVTWIEDGDHDLRPRAASGRTARQNVDEAIGAASGFVAQLAKPEAGS